MTGERLLWFRIASHLHIPVQELALRITYSEFLDWLAFLALEEERQTKTDFYLAQIASEVRRGWVKDPKKVKLKDFLVKVSSEAQAKAVKSKATWAGALGIKLKGDR